MGGSADESLDAAAVGDAAAADGGSDAAGTAAPDAAPVEAEPITLRTAPVRLQAEDYLGGGEGIGYHDTTPGNSGGQYRGNDVDIEKTTDTGGGYSVGWIEPGEWLTYELDVSSAATFEVVARVASGAAGVKTLHVLVDGTAVPAASFDTADGWQSWSDLSLGRVDIGAGSHVLQLYADTAGANVNYLDVKLAGSDAVCGDRACDAAGGEAFATCPADCPLRVEAEDYDEGGEGVGYHDTTAGNTGGEYRTDDVDIQTTSDGGGGYYVGWTAQGEWLAYTIDVGTAADYQIVARVASATTDTKKMHLEVDGAALAAASFSASAGWDSYSDLPLGRIGLTAASHTLVLHADTGHFNVNYLDVKPVGPYVPPERVGCDEGVYLPYRGDLHSHTELSDASDGTYPPGAFSKARSWGLDFQAVTDHLDYANAPSVAPLTASDYQQCKDAADAANAPGTFAAICGYEVRACNGYECHANYLFANSVVADPGTLDAFYSSIAGRRECVGQVNHPASSRFPWTDFTYHANADASMGLVEYDFGKYWLELDRGWHMTPAANTDRHAWDSASARRTIVYATGLSRNELRGAIRAHRTGASNDSNAGLVLMADGCWMGSQLTGWSHATLTVEASDGGPADDTFTRIDLYGNGGTQIASVDCGAGAHACSGSVDVTVTAPMYVFARATQTDGNWVVSAPIWFR